MVSQYGLEVEYEARFVAPPEQPVDFLNKFARYNAPAILFPYLRETVSSITGRTSFSALVMPPLNLQALIDSMEAAKQGEVGSDQSAKPTSS